MDFLKKLFNRDQPQRPMQPQVQQAQPQQRLQVQQDARQPQQGIYSPQDQYAQLRKILRF